jgi:hypothetical protein
MIRKPLLTVPLLILLAVLAFVPSTVRANTLSEPDIFYGIQTQDCSSATALDKWNPTTDTQTTYSLTATSAEGFCNGRGLAWDGTNLWYTVVSFSTLGCANFHGDGLIHKVGPTGGADLGTIPDPYGVCGRGVGAADFDGSGHLWVESYKPTLNGVVTDGCNTAASPTDCRVDVSELDPVTGTVLASCQVPFQGGGEGSDTFAIFGDKQFATDGGEVLLTLFFYQQPSLGSKGGDCVQVTTTSIAGATGLDYASNGDCIYTNGFGSTFNGGPLCTLPSKASTGGGIPFPAEEDLTCACNFLPTPPVPGPTGVPEFGAPAILLGAVSMLGMALFLKFRRSEANQTV